MDDRPVAKGLANISGSRRKLAGERWLRAAGPTPDRFARSESATTADVLINHYRRAAGH